LLTIFRDARRHLHLAVMDNYELTSFSVRTGEILFSRRFFFLVRIFVVQIWI